MTRVDYGEAVIQTATGSGGDSSAAAGPASSLRHARILVVDDIEANRRLIARLLADDGYDIVFALNGRSAIEQVRRLDPDLVLMDVLMPDVNGFDACRELKQDAATRLVPVVLVTALQESDDRIRGIEAGADDFVSKPFNAHELRARVRSLLRIKRYTDDLDTAESVIVSLALTIEARDSYTEGHCHRLARYGSCLGRSLGLDEQDVEALARGGFLHDIGKVGVPDAILLKPDRLTDAEYELMKGHTVIGDRLCGELRSLRRVRPIVRHHHERLDGSGYPDGLAGSDIPLLAQITGIVDVFDALTTDRPYRRGLTAEAACAELRGEAQRGWRSRDLVEAFIRIAANGDLVERP
ncbi:MAG TPA: HD domain-containing phosphohydrolase [Vicinamibacterales bacterium]|nr:HD domain-containing phosphohydrolase [Vicinamibacterales bacterium]